MIRLAAALALAAGLAAPAAASAAPALVKVGDFEAPVHVTGSPGDSTGCSSSSGRAACSRGRRTQGGRAVPGRRVRDVLGRRARPAVDRLPARLPELASLLRLPDGRRERPAPGPRVPALRHRSRSRRPGVAPHDPGDRPPARQPQRRPAAVRARRTAVDRHRRRRRRRRPGRQRPGPHRPARQDAADRPARRGVAGDLRDRAAQPVAVLLRPPDRRPGDRRRRPGRLRGDRLRAGAELARGGRELRLALLRGLPPQPQPQRLALRHAHRRRQAGARAAAQRRGLLDHRRLRGPRPWPADPAGPLPLRRLLRSEPALGRPRRPVHGRQHRLGLQLGRVVRRGRLRADLRGVARRLRVPDRGRGSHAVRGRSAAAGQRTRDDAAPPAPVADTPARPCVRRSAGGAASCRGGGCGSRSDRTSSRRCGPAGGCAAWRASGPRAGRWRPGGGPC